MLDPVHSRPAFEARHLGYSTQFGWFGTVAGKVTVDRAAKKGSVDITIDAAVDQDLRSPSRRSREGGKVLSTSRSFRTSRSSRPISVRRRPAGRRGRRAHDDWRDQARQPQGRRLQMRRAPVQQEADVRRRRDRDHQALRLGNDAGSCRRSRPPTRSFCGFRSKRTRSSSPTLALRSCRRSDRRRPPWRHRARTSSSTSRSAERCRRHAQHRRVEVAEDADALDVGRQVGHRHAAGDRSKVNVSSTLSAWRATRASSASNASVRR